ncbi:MAG: DUF2313 domain-containing protein [Desulfobacteraceae bacterium]|nr:DUF2313 domain-containing protein [Desulfobacteraceae bacterium]
MLDGGTPAVAEYSPMVERRHRNVLALLTPVTLGPNHDADMRIEGEHLDRAQADAQQLLREMFPDTCFALLPDWERLLGLPDGCVGQLPTVAQRIAAAAAKWGEKRALSKSHLIAAAARLGYTITITSYAMRRFGQAVIGGDYTGREWAGTITVNAPAVAVHSRGYGAAVYGEAYRTWGFTALECAIQRLRPAHVNVIFSYDT